MASVHCEENTLEEEEEEEMEEESGGEVGSQAVILGALGSRGRLIWLQMKRGKTESEESGVREEVRGSDSVGGGAGRM